MHAGGVAKSATGIALTVTSFDADETHPSTETAVSVTVYEPANT